MPKYSDRVGDVLQALSDPTRRAVVERLGRGPVTTSDLAAPFDMTMPSLMQHLVVLERSGLITSSKTGRVRTYRLTDNPFAPMERWIDSQRRVWQRRLDQLDAFLSTPKETR